MASHSLTDASRLGTLTPGISEATSAEAPRLPIKRQRLMRALAWDSLPYWERRRLHWKELLIGLSACGAGLALWLYFMGKLV